MENLFAVAMYSGEIIDLKTTDQKNARHKVVNSLDLSESWTIIKGNERYFVEVPHEHFICVQDVLAVKGCKRYWWTASDVNSETRSEAKMVCQEFNSSLNGKSVSDIYKKRESFRISQQKIT